MILVDFQKVAIQLIKPKHTSVSITGERGSGETERSMQACGYLREKYAFDAILWADCNNVVDAEAGVRCPAPPLFSAPFPGSLNGSGDSASDSCRQKSAMRRAEDKMMVSMVYGKDKDNHLVGTKVGDFQAKNFYRFFSPGDKFGQASAKVSKGVTKKTMRGSGPMVCAIKRVQEFQLKEREKQALLREVRILRALQHTNVVGIYQFFKDDPDYMVLEYMSGGELFDRIVPKTYYNEEEARDVCRVFLDSVKYYQELGIVHRDLKPENLLLASKDNDAGIKLADFGFACSVLNGPVSDQCGSPGYVAPEILRALPYGTSVDMWSISVVIYTLLGGYPPFHDENQTRLFRRIKAGSFKFHGEYWSEISPEAKVLLVLDNTDVLLDRGGDARDRLVELLAPLCSMGDGVRLQLLETSEQRLLRETHERFCDGSETEDKVEPLKRWAELLSSPRSMGDGETHKQFCDGSEMAAKDGRTDKLKLHTSLPSMGDGEMHKQFCDDSEMENLPLKAWDDFITCLNVLMMVVPQVYMCHRALLRVATARVSRGKSGVWPSPLLGVIAAAGCVPGVAATETFGERLEPAVSALLHWMCHAHWSVHAVIVTLAGVTVYKTIISSIRDIKAGNAEFAAAWRESFQAK